MGTGFLFGVITVQPVKSIKTLNYIFLKDEVYGT